jgi:hypothetical protein
MAAKGLPRSVRGPAFWGAIFLAYPLVGLGWQFIAKTAGGRIPALDQIVRAVNTSEGQ